MHSPLGPAKFYLDQVQHMTKQSSCVCTVNMRDRG